MTIKSTINGFGCLKKNDAYFFRVDTDNHALMFWYRKYTPELNFVITPLVSPLAKEVNPNAEDIELISFQDFNDNIFQDTELIPNYKKTHEDMLKLFQACAISQFENSKPDPDCDCENCKKRRELEATENTIPPVIDQGFNMN